MLLVVVRFSHLLLANVRCNAIEVALSIRAFRRGTKEIPYRRRPHVRLRMFNSDCRFVSNVQIPMNIPNCNLMGMRWLSKNGGRNYKEEG